MKRTPYNPFNRPPFFSVSTLSNPYAVLREHVERSLLTAITKRANMKQRTTPSRKP
jgi:hypothetical protein